jgi:hypothetical protein
MSGNVWIKSGVVTDILPTVTPLTGVATGGSAFKPSPYTSFQGIINGTGAITATIIIDCSNDNVNWNVTPLGTITLSGTTAVADGFTTTAPWKYVRARITAVSGTISSIYVKMGV